MQHNHEEPQWHAEVSEASKPSETPEGVRDVRWAPTSRPRLHCRSELALSQHITTASASGDADIVIHVLQRSLRNTLIRVHAAEKSAMQIPQSASPATAASINTALSVSTTHDEVLNALKSNLKVAGDSNKLSLSSGCTACRRRRSSQASCAQLC